jgi:hypothetical protein
MKLPVATLEEAPKTTEVLAPAATVKGLGGFEVTPAGRELRATWTTPAKPFRELTETLTAELVAPCVMEMELEERLSEKSASGGGGGGPEDELPQPAHIDASERRTAAGTP